MISKPLSDPQNFQCPLPLPHNEKIVMGHGSGGLMTRCLIRDIFHKYFSNPILDQNNDAAVIDVETSNRFLVTSTDGHIISPLFFPGGDIGKLAVCGAVNDVSMMGAQPLYLTVSFIIEEGFDLSLLEEVARSMQAACNEAGVSIIAGDTKVTEKGKGDGLYLSTTAIGFLQKGNHIKGQNAKIGDAVLISGTIGDHGTAVLQARGDLGFKSEIKSDIVPLNGLIAGLLHITPSVHVLRDPTRGGVGTTLVEIAQQSGVCIRVDEDTLPIRSDVQSVCDMLGFDPLYVANEGKVLILLPEEDVESALNYLHTHPYGRNAARIGSVIEGKPGRVLLRTKFGSNRIIDMLSGEMLPRIC